MKVLLNGRVAFLCALVLTGAARAEAPKPLSAPAPAAAAKPAPAPAAPKPAPQTAPAPASGMSESKYLGLLYAEIAKHTPEENASGPGEVRASFIVGASGKIEKVTIDKTTSPAHAEMVKKILAAVVVPAPPGGAMDVGQTFKFR
ncbi:energy transducer TonB [Methylocystis iwaonis]|uniref:energy transducer TonB n=1 Tax=Methylocystis iwaonis TaxID=2885079 RepID=UPI002E7B529B|nr:energy transducer TonB [Methylocystis iwaonis]